MTIVIKLYSFAFEGKAEFWLSMSIIMHLKTHTLTIINSTEKIMNTLKKLLLTAGLLTISAAASAQGEGVLEGLEFLNTAQSNTVVEAQMEIQGAEVLEGLAFLYQPQNNTDMNGHDVLSHMNVDAVIEGMGFLNTNTEDSMKFLAQADTQK